MKDNPGKMSFGKALEDLRRKKSFTMELLSLKTGIDLDDIDDLINGKVLPSLRIVDQICNSLQEPKEFWHKLRLQDKLYIEEYGVKLIVI